VLIGAIEAGGTKFICALARHDGTIVARTRIATRHPSETWADVVAFFRTASAEHGAIDSFGVASFGPIDIDPASPAYGTITTRPSPAGPGRGIRMHWTNSPYPSWSTPTSMALPSANGSSARARA
jgi:fructokinase